MRINAIKRMNMLAAASSGAALALYPELIGQWLGTTAVGQLRLLGIVTLLYGAHVLVSSLRARQSRSELLYFALCDAGWVAVTVLALAAGAITTASGSVAAGALAAAVTLFGLRYHREARRLRPA
jgi:hypothetical protein